MAHQPRVSRNGGTRRIASIAPKEFQRQGGDWEVRINGSEENAFYVFSPAYLEAETDQDARNPYTYVPQDGVVDWILVVPLYRDGRSIDLESIVVVDRATGDVVLEADLQRKGRIAVHEDREGVLLGM